MKEPLRGIRFNTVPEILQAVDRSIRTINTTGAAEGILRLPHRWQWVVTAGKQTNKETNNFKVIYTADRYVYYTTVYRSHYLKR